MRYGSAVQLVVTTWMSVAAASQAVTMSASVTLDEAVAAALKNHPALAEARAAAAEARAGAGIAGAWPNPTLEAGSGRGRADNGPSGSERSWSLLQAFPWPGRRRAGIRAAEAASVTAEATSVRTEADVAQEVALLFLDACQARKRQEALAESASALGELAELLKRRADAGEGRPLEAMRAAVEAGRFRQEVETARSEATGLYAQLQLATGGALPDGAALLLPSPDTTPLPATADLQAELESRSPDLAEAGAVQEEARLRAAAERRQWWPDLDVGTFRNEEVDKVSSGATLAVGLPILWRNRYGVARAEAAMGRAAAERDVQRLRRLQDLASARAGWEAARRRREAFETEIIPAARRSLEIARFSLEQGETSLLELLDARRSWLAVSVDAEAARIDEIRQRLRIDRLVGKGAR